MSDGLVERLAEAGVPSEQAYAAWCEAEGIEEPADCDRRLIAADRDAVLRVLLEAEAGVAEAELHNGHPDHINVCLRSKAEAIRRVLEWLDVPLPPLLAPEGTR